MNSEREILVHISTSATRKNDNLYRSLADAYQSFESHDANARLNLISPQGKDRVGTNVTTSKDDFGSFPSHMGSSDRSNSQNQNYIHTASSFYEESQLPTSRLGRLERIQAKWRQTAPRSSAASAQRSSAAAPVSSGFSDGAIIDDTQLAYQALESQVFDHMSATSEDTSDDEPVVVRAPLAESTSNPRMVSDVTTRKTPLSSGDLVSSQSALCVVTPSTPIHPAHKSPASTPQIQSSQSDACSPNFGSLPLEIFPPGPPVTILSPGKLPSQTTKFLVTLKEQNPHRFKPRRISRALNDDERGCWVVETSRWPRAVQHQFWLSLVNYISSGRLGWGVTLHREPEKLHELGLVRVYCWGEVVEHTWLALWMCSDGNLSGFGSQWIDAEEKVTIEMVGRS